MDTRTVSSTPFLQSQVICFLGKFLSVAIDYKKWFIVKHQKWTDMPKWRG